MVYVGLLCGTWKVISKVTGLKIMQACIRLELILGSGIILKRNLNK
jgi:hypothetical protein